MNILFDASRRPGLEHSMQFYRGILAEEDGRDPRMCDVVAGLLLERSGLTGVAGLEWPGLCC